MAGDIAEQLSTALVLIGIRTAISAAVIAAWIKLG
jgi:hypothetical protein